MIYAWHHAAALAGAILLGLVVHRREWTRARPRTAVLLWHLLLFTVAIALVGLLLSIALRALGLGVLPAVGAIRTVRLSTGDVVALSAALTVLTAGLGVQVVTTVQRRRARSRHRALLDVVGDDSRPGLVVLEHEGVAVYTVPGRRPRVVATAGALDRLTATELNAVLEHEHGHVAGRHDLALFPFAVLRRTLPRSRIAAALETEISVLLELCADAHAVRRGHRDGLLHALGVLGRDDAADIRRARLEQRSPGRVAVPLLSCAAAILLTTTTLSLYLLPL